MPERTPSKPLRQPASRAQFLRGGDSRSLPNASAIDLDRFVQPVNKRLSPVDVVRPQPFAKPARPKQEASHVLRRPAQPAVAQPVLRQQLQPETPPPPETVRRESRGIARLQAALITMACLVFSLGVLVSVETLITNHSAKAQVSALSAKADDSDAPPSETKPSDSSIASYTVAPQLPRYLKIPELNVDARVMSVGVTKTGALGTPNNIYDTAWYNASARPGDAGSNGAVLIDGHVHGPTLPGVFVDIKKLQLDDTIQIVRGDGKVFNYTVKKVQNYDASTLNTGTLLASIQPGEPGLNLVTCGGPFDKVSGEYTQRTVVFAVQS